MKKQKAGAPMRMRNALLVVFLLGALPWAPARGATAFRQVYPMDPLRVAANAARVRAGLEKAPSAWKDAPAVFFTVPPLRDVIRLPDTYPEDGVLLGTLRILAAKGEFEPGSVVIYPLKNVDRFTLRASDLTSPSGGRIVASGIDIRLVKVWYQCGNAWYSQFADPSARMLIPENLP